MKLLIGLLSAWKYHGRRELCRETWIPDIRQFGHEVVFLMGIPNVGCREGDLLILPTPDDYPTLPRRTHHFCKWALTQPDWDFCLKADDDTLYSAPRLHKFAQRLEGGFVGCEYHPQMPYHSGGAGYFLSRDAVEILACKMTQPEGPEDMIAGEILNTYGFPTTYLPGTEIGNNSDRRRPMPGNPFIAAHGRWLTEELWRESWTLTRGEL